MDLRAGGLSCKLESDRRKFTGPILTAQKLLKIKDVKQS